MQQYQTYQNGYSFPNKQNSNTFLKSNINVNNNIPAKKHKVVKFDDNVVIYNVESYKELNKKFCYNEEEALANYYGIQSYENTHFNDYKFLYENKNNNNYNNYNYNYNNYNKNYYNATKHKKKSNSECSCIIL